MKTNAINNDALSGRECQATFRSFVSGFGGYHTADPAKKNPKPYTTINFDQIKAMAENPLSVPKDTAQWLIPSSTGGEEARGHAFQREKGDFHALWADLDEVQGSTFQEVEELIKQAIPEVMALVYTTRSATAGNPKCRIIIPLAMGIPGVDYSIMAKILNDRLEAAGLMPDRATERTGQLCYLPNRGEFYQYTIIDGEILNSAGGFAEEIQAEHARLKAEAKERERRHQESVQKIQARINSGQANPIEAFKAEYPVELALQRYGYTRCGNKWLSPNSESGNPGVSVKDGKWYSHHDSDSGIGQPGSDGGTWGDPFDLFVWYEHGGNFSQAVKAAGELFTTTDPETGEIVTITQLNQKLYMQTLNRSIHGQMPIQKSLQETSNRQQTLDDQDEFKENRSDEEDASLWNFEEAETHINKHEDRDLTISQKWSLIRDILENSDFDPLQADLIQDLIKKKIGINKTALAKFKKHQSAGSKDNSEERTHAELSLDFMRDVLPDDPAKYTGCEGSIWLYNNDGGIFNSWSLDDVGTRVGDLYKSKYCKRGSDYDSVAKRIYIRTVDENFFKDAPRGLPSAKGFYNVDTTGTGEIIHLEYTPELRQRFKLDYDPDWNHKAPCFFKYLDDSFPGNQSQKDLVQEIFGALLTGLAAKLQIAILFYGFGANGKSILMAIIYGLVSDDLKCSVKPDMFGNEYYRAQLAGKLINIVGEIDKDKHLTADFKDIVGCDVPVTARSPYERPFRFIPQCGHLFAGNSFPLTKDHSYGHYRRWRIVHFKHTVPEGKRIPDLAKKILKTETPGILAWALDGASRLVQNNFELTATSEHDALIAQWQLAGDSVMAFLNDDSFISIGDSSICPKREAYDAYKKYCFLTGFRALKLQNFYSQVFRKFQETRDTENRRVFQGFEVVPA
jgi:P4 family phage/plasmid primase-like protien